MLHDYQMRLRAWITAPEGVEEFGDEVAELLLGDARASARERLGIYASAYFHRIHDVLREDHGALHGCLGNALFHDLVTAFLLAHPPSKPSLRHAGDPLPDYLERAAGAAPFRRACPWAADLARVERARLDVFDAADDPLLARSALEAIAPEDWESLRFRFVAAHRIVHCAWPVQHLLVAHEDGRPLPTLDPEASTLLVWRTDERVFQRVLDDGEARALAAARKGATFGALCEGAADAVGESEAPPLAAGWLGRWQADALLSRPR